MSARGCQFGGMDYPRWLAGRDAYDSDLEPGGGYLVHLGNPGFVCRWTMGDPPLSTLSFTDVANLDAGESDDYNLSLYDFVWLDAAPEQAAFRELMREAVAAADHFIRLLYEEYDSA